MATKKAARRKWGVRQLLLLWYGWRDPRTPWYAKMTAIAALLYVVSPIDIVPDFIPVAGWIDDILVAPFLLGLAANLLPADVQVLAAQKAMKRRRQGKWLLVAAILVLAVLVGWIIWRYNLSHRYDILVFYPILEFIQL